MPDKWRLCKVRCLIHIFLLIMCCTGASASQSNYAGVGNYGDYTEKGSKGFLYSAHIVDFNVPGTRHVDENCVLPKVCVAIYAKCSTCKTTATLDARNNMWAFVYQYVGIGDRAPAATTWNDAVLSIGLQYHELMDGVYEFVGLGGVGVSQKILVEKIELPIGIGPFSDGERPSYLIAKSDVDKVLFRYYRNGAWREISQKLEHAKSIDGCDSMGPKKCVE